jgi:hypothetical protein
MDVYKPSNQNHFSLSGGIKLVNDCIHRSWMFLWVCSNAKADDLSSSQVAVTKITRGLPVPRLLAKRVKGPKGEKRRSISGTVIDTHQCNQTKTGRWTAYLWC